MATGDEVGLADAIRALRSELGNAVAEGKDQDIRFRLGPVEMEFQLEVEKKVGGGGGIKFWVVTIGGQASRSSGTTHRVKLSLQPIGPEGQDIDVSNQVGQRPQ